MSKLLLKQSYDGEYDKNDMLLHMAMNSRNNVLLCTY